MQKEQSLPLLHVDPDAIYSATGFNLSCSGTGIFRNVLSRTVR